MKKLFTKEQENYIVNNYLTMKYKDIALNLGKEFNATQISGWLHNNNYKKGHNSIFSKTDCNYIQANYKVKTYKEIANKLGFSEKQIRHYVNHYLDKKNRVFNDRYFEYIDTANKAYWIGYLYADGCVINNPATRSYEVCLKLQKLDIKVLEDLNNELGGVHDISEEHFEGYILNNKNITVSDSVSLRIYSKKMVEDLIRHGVVPNKTYEEDYPKLENFFLDFVRGYIDGDGCIYINKNNYLSVHITSFKKNVLDYISNRLKSEYEIDTYVYKENDRKYRLVSYGKKAKKLLDAIYYNKNVQKLDRKYKKYLILE